MIANIGQEECRAIQRVSNALPIMLANNPTSKWVLLSKARTHQRMTWCNTPGVLPKITHPEIAPPLWVNTQTPFAAPHMINDTPPTAMVHKVPQLQTWKTKTLAVYMVPRQSMRLTSGVPHIHFCNSRIISQEAINLLLINDLQNNTVPFTPTTLTLPPTPTVNFKHCAMRMMHPTTGKTISSYKQLMNNPVIADTWQTAFGKDFGIMCQGDNKTGAKGTKVMFVMKLEEVD